MPWYRMADGTPFHAKIGGRKERVPAPCAAKRDDGSRCGQISGYLCDWPVNDQGDTCDAPLCATHANVVADDRHLCPKHKALDQQAP